MSSSPPSVSQQCRPALDRLGDASLVPISLIDDSLDQPRAELPDVEALAANIRSYGLLQPVLLRRVGARYQILSGHRRVAAYRCLHGRHASDPQWSAILSLVTRTTDETAHFSMVSAQIHIAGWTPAEEREVLQRLQKTGMSLTDISALLHRDISWTSKRIRVLEDPEIGPHVLSGELKVTVGEEILPVEQPQQRQDLVERAANEGWSQRRARREVRARAAVSDIGEAADVRELRRVVRELLTLMRRVKPEQVQADALADLWALHDQLERLPRPRRRPRAA